MDNDFTLGDYLELAFMIAWLVVAVYLSIKLRVWSPASLAKAPMRQSKVSLAAVAGVIVLYIFSVNLVLGVASAMHLVADLSPAPVVTPPANTQAASASAPAGTTQSAMELAPATTAAAPQTTPTTLPKYFDPENSPSVRAGNDLYDRVSREQIEKRDRQFAIDCVDSVGRLLTIGICLAFVPLLFRDRFRGIGLHVSQVPRGALGGVLGFLVIFPVLGVLGYAIGWLYEHLGHKIVVHPVLQHLDASPPVAQVLGYAVMAMVVAPVAEEFVFRGLLQTAVLQQGFGLIIPQFAPPSALQTRYVPRVSQRYVAILISAAAFTLVHPLDNGPIIFPLALALGYVYERTGSLYAPIVLHAAFNGMEIVPLLLGKSP